MAFIPDQDIRAVWMRNTGLTGYQVCISLYSGCVAQEWHNVTASHARHKHSSDGETVKCHPGKYHSITRRRLPIKITLILFH